MELLIVQTEEPVHRQMLVYVLQDLEDRNAQVNVTVKIRKYTIFLINITYCIESKN